MRHRTKALLVGIVALAAGATAAAQTNLGSVTIGGNTTSAVTVTFASATTPASIAVVTQGNPSLDFTNATGGTCAAGTAYAANAACTVNVEFAPQFAGARYGAVVLEDANGVVATVYLQGTGLGPQVNFLPGTQSIVANAATSGLYEPFGVAVDGSGNVYIADTSKNQVLKETLSAGVYTTSVVAHNDLSVPYGVAVDGGGNVYVADTYNNRVLKVTLTAGNYIQSVVANGLQFPYGVAVDGSGNVYITDDSDQVLKETLSAGNYTQSIVANKANNGLSDPQAVAVDGSGNVYIADNTYGSTGFTSSRVLKETLSAGGYTQSIVANSATNGLSYPLAVAVDGTGNVYIADSGNGRVLKETLAAASYTQTILANSANNGLGSLSGVAVDGSGNVYIADNAKDRVLKEDFADPPSLSFAATPPGAASIDSPQTVSLWNDGNAPLTFPIPASGDNPSISGDFTLNSSATSSCPLVAYSAANSGTLAAGASCLLPISFTPTTTGTLSGSLALTDNNLNGTNVLQTLPLSGNSLALESITIASASAGLQVGWTDQFTAAATLSDKSTENVTSAVAWASTQTTVATIGASGLATALAAGSTNITASWGGETSNSLSLGVAAETPTAYVVPTETIGTSSATQTAALWLPSGFTLGSIAVVTQGAANLDFNYASGGTCTVGTAYAAGQTCTVNYTFKPMAPGTRMGAISLYDSSSPTPVLQVTVFLAGTAAGPLVNFMSGAQSVVANSATNGLDAPEGVAVDGSGNVYITDTTAAIDCRVLKETFSAGSYTQSVIASNVVDAGTKDLYFPSSVAVDGAGNVYIAVTGYTRYFVPSQVLKETLSAGSYAPSVIASFALYGSDDAEGVAVDGSGNVYIADTSNNQVLKETLSWAGYTQSVVANAATNGLYQPEGVAVDGSGNVYIADTNNGRVLKETFAGGSYTQSVVANAATNGLYEPQGVAVDGSGNVYIADYQNNRVLRETPSADGYTQSVIANAATNGLDAPYGVAVDGSGNVYITDTGNDRVLKEDFADPPSLSFAATAVGAISTDSPQTVTLWNDGNATLIFPIPTSGINPTISANFTLNGSGASACQVEDAGSAAEATLAPGASCELAINFAPEAKGAFSGSLVFTDNNLNAPAPAYASQSIALKGATPQATPQITWAIPAAIAYGTALGAAQLDATSSVAGTFAYSPAAGTVLTAGPQTLKATFTPTDTTDYTTAMATVTLTVNEAAPTITWPTPAAITYGAGLGAAQLDATSSVAGSFAYSPSSGVVLGAGSQALKTTFTPTDTTDYTTASASVTLTVNQATPIVTWATPAAIFQGTALSATQLDATASVPGTFVYTPALGATPAVGNDTLSVTFTPTDSVDYSAVTATVTLTVNVPLNPVPFVGNITPAIADAGGAAFTITVNGSGFLANSTVYWATSALTTVFVSSTELTATVTAADIATPGAAAITVQTPAPGGGMSDVLQFEVDSPAAAATAPTVPTAVVTVTAGSTATYSISFPVSVTNATASCLNLPAGALCSFSFASGILTISTSSTTPAGTYQVTVVFDETVSSTSSGFILLPLLLLPVYLLRRKLTRRGVWAAVGLSVMLAGAVAFSVGCGGSSSSSTTKTTTQAVTSSGVVGMAVH